MSRRHLRIRPAIRMAAVLAFTAVALPSSAVADARPTLRCKSADLRAGQVALPRSVAGFSFTSLPPTAAQTYNERGRRRTTTIRFDYRVPNG